MTRTAVSHICFSWLLLALGGCDVAPDPSGASVTAIVGGDIVTGTGDEPLRGATVLIADDRIEAIGPADEIDVPPEATVIDARGKTVLPGIINAHVHTNRDQRAVLRAFLEDGVTTICETGGPTETAAALREAGRAPDVARAFSSGRVVTAPGGYPSARSEAVVRSFDSVATAEEAVAEVAADGADYLKITLQPIDFFNLGEGDTSLPVPEADEIRAAVRTAHELGLLARAHIHSPELLEQALDAGVDVVEHILFSLPADETMLTLYEQGGLFLEQLPDAERVIDVLVDADVFLVPTLENETEAVPTLLKPEYSEQDLEVLRAFAFDIVGAYHGKGGKIALGNDWNGFHSIELGMPMREMEMLEASGLTPMEIIQAGTLHAATVCGQDERLGTLEVGKLADVLIVDGDASTDIQALDQVDKVLRDGVVVFDAKAPT